ncbi:NCS1 family nucleobase:cation symporter-1 [Scopulibacillus darangshiensis]|uniref:NCS1 family nucleobase:cation symporter-1 n=1 Tax=Scopulibacillus darangshiensis TaxID=442528 RepID=A0A4R2NYC0_9BACL|nr:cytosine permease [Scopulibacillus darangshiensis]TCP27087.1 NCS1 family nucleobase:cation symporter-1 [Scopulibacillus darangshiensis]
MKIEQRSVDFIPEDERYGKPSSLFNIWFAGNMHVTTLVTGALVVTFGLNLFWSVLALILGNCLGAIFMALHSAQGPKLGIPQMIQSRAQFGVYGAAIPIVIVILMYLGFFASSNVLGSEVLSSTLSISPNVSVILFSIVAFFIALFGYDLIHKMQKYLTWIFIIVFAIVTVIVFRMPLPAGSWSMSGFNPAAFMLSVSVVATWQLTYAPYVADYSRYLPINTSTSKSFWYTYCGSVIGTFWMMLLGVILTIAVPHYLDHASSNLAHLFGTFALIMFVIIFLGQISIDVYNLYGAFMSSTTAIQPFFNLKVTPKVRLILLLCITVIGTLLAIWGRHSFLAFFSNFILFLTYFLIPWTTINLVDFYLLRRGHYNTQDVFDGNGQYGKINWITTVAYIVSILAEIPFINTSFYMGPIAHALNGADLAWIIGLIIPGVLYYFPMKRQIRINTSNMQNKGI